MRNEVTLKRCFSVIFLFFTMCGSGYNRDQGANCRRGGQIGAVQCVRSSASPDARSEEPTRVFLRGSWL